MVTENYKTELHPWTVEAPAQCRVCVCVCDTDRVAYHEELQEVL